MGKKVRKCRVCKRRPVWIGGDLKIPAPVDNDVVDVYPEVNIPMMEVPEEVEIVPYDIFDGLDLPE